MNRVVLLLGALAVACGGGDFSTSRSPSSDAGKDVATSSGGGTGGTASTEGGLGGTTSNSGGSNSGGTGGPTGAGGSGGASKGGASGSASGSSGSGGASGSGGSHDDGGPDSGSCADDLSNIHGGGFHISFDVLSMPQSSGPLLEQRAVCDPYSVDWIIAEQATYNIIVQIGDGAGYVNLESIATINDGVWHYVVVARVSATLSITIDGQLDNSIPNGGLSLGPLALLQVGKSACATPFAGQVKNVCVTRH